MIGALVHYVREGRCLPAIVAAFPPGPNEVTLMVMDPHRSVTEWIISEFSVDGTEASWHWAGVGEGLGTGWKAITHER